MLETKLKTLLDFQRFAQNPRLARIIAETEHRCGLEQAPKPLDEDWLSEVSAAGDEDARRAEERNHGKS